MYRNLAIFPVFVFLYKHHFGRLEKTPITVLIVYALSGLAIGVAGLGILEFAISSSELCYTADIALTLVLFIK